MITLSYPIFLVGFSGCGKSSTARKLSALLRGKSIDLDQFIEHNTGKSISEIFADEGESFFRKLESDTLHGSWLLQYTVIATGGGCPCFFDNMDYMNSMGITVYLKAPASILAQRVKYKKTARPLLAQIDDDQLVEEIEHQLMEREPIYSKAHIVFPAFNLNPYQLIHEIEKYKIK
ncbi:MAG: shikimate kinase [Bacteroidales bacterium]|nr:shikimate kinase [Bacteroidales bacterium]